MVVTPTRSSSSLDDDEPAPPGGDSGVQVLLWGLESPLARSRCSRDRGPADPRSPSCGGAVRGALGPGPRALVLAARCAGSLSCPRSNVLWGRSRCSRSRLNPAEFCRCECKRSTPARKTRWIMRFVSCFISLLWPTLDSVVLCTLAVARREVKNRLEMLTKTQHRAVIHDVGEPASGSPH